MRYHSFSIFNLLFLSIILISGSTCWMMCNPQKIKEGRSDEPRSSDPSVSKILPSKENPFRQYSLTAQEKKQLEIEIQTIAKNLETTQCECNQLQKKLNSTEASKRAELINIYQSLIDSRKKRSALQKELILKRRKLRGIIHVDCRLDLIRERIKNCDSSDPLCGVEDSLDDPIICPNY